MFARLIKEKEREKKKKEKERKKAITLTDRQVCENELDRASCAAEYQWST